MTGHVLTVAALTLTLVVAGCTAAPSPVTDPPPMQVPDPPPAEVPALPPRGYFMGTLPVPARGQSFEQVHAQVAEHAEFVPVWGRPSPFHALADDLAGSWGRLFVGEYVRDKGLFAIVHLSFIGPGMTLVVPPGLEGATLSDPAWRGAYRQAALDCVLEARPPYLSLGNEVNRWYEQHGAREGDPSGFQHYVSLYVQTYQEVKRASPDTIVFCTFAREIVSEVRQADLGVLELFPADSLDLLVFTTYPYAVRGINRPGDIPDDYYTRALDHFPASAVGFSEAGWPSLDAFGGEAGQAEFLDHLTTRLTADPRWQLRLLGWPWLHDLDEGDSMGLIRADGSPKAGYGTWTRLSEGR